MDRIYIPGLDEVPQHLTLKDNDLLRLTFVFTPGFSGDIPFGIDILRPGVTLDIAGLYLCKGGEKVRLRTTVRHMEGGATSRQLFKGIVGGGASFSFDGLIYVAHGAAGTKAYQENHTILLDPSGIAQTSPQLEIYNDDVECSHGATVGALNPDEEYYMRSRGIPEQEARRLQILSFLSPIMSRLPEHTSRQLLKAL